MKSITNIDHSQGRGCGGPGETIPLLALTSVIRLDGDDDDGNDDGGGHDAAADGNGGDDDADDNEKEVEVVHSSTAADTCDTSYVFSSHILVSPSLYPPFTLKDIQGRTYDCMDLIKT